MECTDSNVSIDKTTKNKVSAVGAEKVSHTQYIYFSAVLLPGWESAAENFLRRKKALCQVLGGDSLNHAPLLDLELFLYLIYFTMILGMANKPSSAHLKIN